MWEHICRLLRKWIDAGFNPAPISVNVFRINLLKPNLAGRLCELMMRYNVPPRLLQLEMTESAYMDYSSLNTRKDIHVDVLKTDMKFLTEESEIARSRSILASIVLMAGRLNMPVIMEGGETAEQISFLQSIGCNYVQGCCFAKPMPAAEYEALIPGVSQAARQSQSENLISVVQALWSAESQNELVFKTLEEPAAVYEATPGYLVRIARRPKLRPFLRRRLSS
jgi:EAL domain-containing protein (putative c-di-GMP-specific phosphodiesterase class I)